MKNIKNAVLATVSWICLFIFIAAACLLDSESWVPFYACLGTGAWLALFAYANNWFEDEDGGE